jgi:hypothetical protein
MAQRGEKKPSKWRAASPVERTLARKLDRLIVKNPALREMLKTIRPDWKFSGSSSGMTFTSTAPSSAQPEKHVSQEDLAVDSDDLSEKSPSEDPYLEVIKYVTSLTKVTRADLRERFIIGEKKTTTYMNRLFRDGHIGPRDGNRPRPVIATQHRELISTTDVSRSVSMDRPPELYTETGQSFAVVGNPRMGKTYLAIGMIERYRRTFDDSSLNIVIIDPKGDDWKGLRSGAHSMPFVIVGKDDDEADFDIGDDPSLAAEKTVELMFECHSVLVDLGGADEDMKCIFFTSFKDALFREARLRVKAGTMVPNLVVIDEAQELAPQSTTNPNQKSSKDAMVSLLAQGPKRSVSLCCILSQRPANLNKGVLELCPNIFIKGMYGPNDLDAIERYVQPHGKEAARNARQIAAKLTKYQALYVGRHTPYVYDVPSNQTEDGGTTPVIGRPLTRISLAPLPTDVMTRGEVVWSKESLGTFEGIFEE